MITSSKIVSCTAFARADSQVTLDTDATAFYSDIIHQECIILIPNILKQDLQYTGCFICCLGEKYSYACSYLPLAALVCYVSEYGGYFISMCVCKIKHQAEGFSILCLS
jgi:hypothetical protein